MNEALGLLETTGLTPSMAAIDAMEKAADVRVLHCELNDLLGVVTKIAGGVEAVRAAVDAGRRVAETMGGRPVAEVIPRPDPRAWEGIRSPRQYNPLIEQDVVFYPEFQAAQPCTAEEHATMQEGSLALGFIETQGFTAAFEAVDTACKVANVEVVGKEKLGGGYIAIVIRGDLAAVTAAVEAGRQCVDELGKLIAAHVVARPSKSVLGLLPKP